MDGPHPHMGMPRDPTHLLQAESHEIQPWEEHRPSSLGIHAMGAGCAKVFRLGQLPMVAMAS